MNSPGLTPHSFTRTDFAAFEAMVYVGEVTDRKPISQAFARRVPISYGGYGSGVAGCVT